MSPSVFFPPIVFQALNIFDSLQYDQAGICGITALVKLVIACHDLYGAKVNARQNVAWLGDKGVYIWEAIQRNVFSERFWKVEFDGKG